jgi:hypothetical protein
MNMCNGGSLQVGVVAQHSQITCGRERARSVIPLKSGRRCSVRRYGPLEKPRITMYNYGCPRVGNAAFARAYDTAVPDSWRVTNRLDMVPRVPRLMGYCHVGNSVTIRPDGSFEVNGVRPLTLQTRWGFDLLIRHAYRQLSATHGLLICRQLCRSGSGDGSFEVNRWWKMGAPCGSPCGSPACCSC